MLFSGLMGTWQSMAHSLVPKFSSFQEQNDVVPNVFQECSLPCATPRDKEVNQPFTLLCSSAGWWHFQKGLKADCHALQYHNS